MKTNSFINFFKRNPKIFEFFKFGLVGVVALTLHYGIYYLLMQFVDVNVAFTIGYIISFLVNFKLTTLFTFEVKATVKKGLGFAISHFINYFLQVGLLNLFLKLGIEKSLAPVPVFAICVPLNFILVRFFVKDHEKIK